MKNRKFSASLLMIAATYCFLSLLILRVVVQGVERAGAQVTPQVIHEVAPRDHVANDVADHLVDNAAAAAAFEAMVPVLRHPRCMNCHSKGDFPRQGDDNHRHTMLIRRGPDGHGVNAVRCSTCHQDHNLAGLHLPPGAPDWHLPSPGMPMIWEGLTDHQLCELLKDPQQNGHRTPAQIVEHMLTPLVLWGWTPGEGRTAIPTPQPEFLAKVEEWAAKGAACPLAASARVVSGHR